MLSRKQPHVLALGLTVALFVLAVLYGKFTFYRDPGSIFFDPDRALERQYSVYRQNEALTYRDQARARFQDGAEGSATSYWNSGDNAFLCGAFVTMGRETIGGAHPLELSIASALTGLTQSEREDVEFRIYFANTNPTEHPLMDSWLLKLVDGWTTSQNMADKDEYDKLVKLEAEREFFTKAAYDFRNAIQHCHKTSSAPFIALLEGDILFADGWFARTKLAVQEISARTMARKENWQDLRLFNDEKGIGFDSNSFFGNNVPLIILVVSGFLFASLTFLHTRTTLGKTYFTNATILVLCLVTAPLFVVLFFQSGKSSVLPPSPGITVQNWGCCSQAIIMPRDTSIALADFIVKQAGGPPDMSMNDYANRNSLKRFALNPVQVQHIGLKSLLTPERKQKELVWSVAYEDLDPKKLRKEHGQNVRKLYGDRG